jgi:hypothetical protein
VLTACRNSPGWNTAEPTLNNSTTATSKLLNAFGTTRYTSFSMMGVAAALAAPVTDAAAAPIDCSSDPVVCSEPKKVTGVSTVAMGTVTAPCTTYGQITEQYWNWFSINARGIAPIGGAVSAARRTAWASVGGAGTSAGRVAGTTARAPIATAATPLTQT